MGCGVTSGDDNLTFEEDAMGDGASDDNGGDEGDGEDDPDPASEGHRSLMQA